MVQVPTQSQIYDVRSGSLAETYGLFVPTSINTGAQISADRIKDEGLRSIWLYTANVSLATKRDGKLLLGIGGNAAFNAVFGKNTQEVCQELTEIGYVHLNSDQRDLILRLEESEEVAFVEPSNLKLEGDGNEYRLFPIRTGQYSKDVTVPRVPFVNAGYGSGYMLERVMANLGQEGKIFETRVYIMNPEHAAENVKDDEMVARASGLGGFGGGSRFNADVWGVDFHNALRGVLRSKPAEGRSQKPDLEYLV